MADADHKAQQRQLRLDQKSAVTSRISETSRLVGFGVVAWVFAIHTSQTDFAVRYISTYKFWINIAGFFGMLTIVFDYMQYLCAYFSVNHSLTRSEHNYSYNKNHAGYVFQNVFFVAKQVFAVLASLLVVVTFGLSVVR
jgi:hypothetical protein